MTTPNGNADNSNGTNNGNTERTPEERIEALDAKNRELLGKLSDEKNGRKELEGKLGQVFEHLGIDTNGGDPFEQLNAKKQADAKAKLDNMSKAEKTEHELSELRTLVSELTERNKAADEKALKLELDSTVNSALTENGVNAKGLTLLGNFVKSGIQRDDNGYFAIDNGTRITVADYTKSIASQYPEFIGTSTKVGSGTNDPQRQTSATRIADSVKQNKPRSTIQQLVAEQLNK